LDNGDKIIQLLTEIRGLLEQLTEHHKKSLQKWNNHLERQDRALKEYSQQQEEYRKTMQTAQDREKMFLRNQKMQVFLWLLMTICGILFIFYVIYQIFLH